MPHHTRAPQYLCGTRRNAHRRQTDQRPGNYMRQVGHAHSLKRFYKLRSLICGHAGEPDDLGPLAVFAQPGACAAHSWKSLATAISVCEPGWRPSMINPLPLNAATKLSDMLDNLTPFLVHWGITTLSLWVASHIFRGIRFTDTPSLIVSALLLGFANAIVKPMLIVLTLPLTFLTFGLFLLVINALMMLGVALLVKGFKVSSFWTAFFASIFIAVLSFVIGAFVVVGGPSQIIQMPRSGLWL